MFALYNIENHQGNNSGLGKNNYLIQLHAGMKTWIQQIVKAIKVDSKDNLNLN